MPLPTTIKRGLSLGKSKNITPDPRNKPSVQPSQSSASALQRALHKSTFLYGAAPPTTGTELTPEQVQDLLGMLSQPVSTPMLTTSIARLPSPLSRHPKSLFPYCLCDTHGWFDLRWIDELTDILGAEIGPHLNHLRSVPNWLTSTESKEILDILDPFAHIFPAPDPDGPGTVNPNECNDPKCGVVACKLTCKACKLSTLFQDAEAVKALNICAKGRKKGGRPWPVSCAWLDPLPPRPGWAAKWKKEGLPVLSDRIIARRWRKSGRQERMTEGMKSVQAEVMADRDSAARVLDQMTRQSVQSALVDSDSVYNNITGRPWSSREDATQSSATINLLRKLGLENDDGEEQVVGKGSVPWAKAYEMLTTSQPSSVRGSIHHVDEDDGESEQVGPGGRSTLVAESSRTPNATPFAEQSRERTDNFATASILECSEGRDGTQSTSASTSSRDSVSTWNSSSSRSSRGSRASLLGNESSPSHSWPYLIEGKDGRTESRDSWAYFNNSPLASVRSSGSQTQTMASRSKLDLVEQLEHKPRYSSVPDIPARSAARSLARGRGLSPAHERVETTQSRI